MNPKLVPYLIKNPTHELATIVAVSEPTTRLMSPDMMSSYLDAFRCMIHFSTSTKSAEVTTMVALGGSAEFNFIRGTEIGDAHLTRLDDIIADPEVIADTSLAVGGLTLVQRLTALKAALIAYCTKENLPFADVTQPDIDAAKAEIALIGELESHTTLYNDADAGYMIKLKADTLKFNVIYDAPVTVETTVKLFAESFDTTTGLWLRESQPVTVFHFVVGGQNKQIDSAKGYGSRKTRFVAVSNVNLPLSVRVTVA